MLVVKWATSKIVVDIKKTRLHGRVRNNVVGQHWVQSASPIGDVERPPFHSPTPFTIVQPNLENILMFFTMANLQRVVISLLLMLTASFLFLAQSSEASKGPKITDKVCHLENVLYCQIKS